MRRLAPLGLIVSFVLAITACTTGAPAPGPSSSGGTATKPPATASTVVDQAKLKAAQYDYAGALTLLATDTSAAAQAAKTEIEAAKASAVKVDAKQVPHLFWHPLVVDPKRAFAPAGLGDDPTAVLTQAQKDQIGNTQYMVTQKEFAAQLQSIYDLGYVLIHPSRLYRMVNGVMTDVSAEVKLPPGKKPMVFSQDDTNYYSRWATLGGFPAELVVDTDGTVKNRYQDAQGNWTVGSYDMVPMVDDFVRQHPDFSYQGDKGSIALTGYEGALGYRSSVSVYGDNDKTKKAIADGKLVADAMKAEGWLFASHTFGHISYQQSTPKKIKADMDRWKADVEPVIGKTDQLIFAFGSDITLSITSKYGTDPKFQVLHEEEGFDYFFPIDNSSPYFVQVQPDYYRQWRVNVDGITMQKVRDGKKTAISMFFDAVKVWDPDRPIPTPKLDLGVK